MTLLVIGAALLLILMAAVGLESISMLLIMYFVASTPFLVSVFILIFLLLVVVNFAKGSSYKINS